MAIQIPYNKYKGLIYMYTVMSFYFWLFVKIATREYIFKNILLHGNDTSGQFYNSKLITLSKTSQLYIEAISLSW